MRHSSHRVRHAARPRLALGIAMVAGLVASLVPSPAWAEEEPVPAPTPSPVTSDAPPSQVPVDEPSPVATETPSVPEPGPSPSPSPSAEPSPDPTQSEGEGTRPHYPDPAEYGGDTTIDEAMPGGYAGPEGFRTYSLAGWKAGNIISDEMMFTSGTMSAAEIQSFLNGKVRSCQYGYTCLKDFRQSTVTRDANAYCAGTYRGATNETAAQIISKVSLACNVSEKVLLVMLQKEQGLITHTWPSQFRYDRAMGFACPDTGPGGSANCDPSYAGFGYQMYMAAYQLQRYTKDSYFSWFPVGRTSLIQYDVDRSCGSAPVLIENKATAALYYYTPYQPNAASLAAGYGEGDGCSSYGNRNFYNYYTDWFGPTRYNVQGAIGQKWSQLGGPESKLGLPSAGEVCGIRDNGCYQYFEHGTIHWSSGTGAYATWGAIREAWKAQGFENGKLGYPTSDERCGLVGGGCYQYFERGTVHWTSADGAQPTWGAIRDAWKASGFENGKLGYPVGAEICGLRDNGCYQSFQGGTIHWTSATGAAPTWGAIRAAWAEAGFEDGKLGYPTSAERCGLTGGGCVQNFQGGSVHWHSDRGAFPTWGAIRTAWKDLGWENGQLGYPTSSERCGLTGGGCVQNFQGGSVHWTSSTGARATWGSIRTAWKGVGWETSKLGYPTGPERCTLRNNGCYQTFQGGLIHWSPRTGAHPTWGGIRTMWAKNGYENGVLGYPVANEACDGSSCSQEFEGGRITWRAGGGTTLTRF